MRNTQQPMTVQAAETTLESLVRCLKAALLISPAVILVIVVAAI